MINNPNQNPSQNQGGQFDPKKQQKQQDQQGQQGKNRDKSQSGNW